MGYGSRAYAAAWKASAAWVEPWGAPVIRRPVEGTGQEDVCGCYPLTVFGPAADLRGGLDQLAQTGAVTAALVVDPLTQPAGLEPAFDIVRPFKTHYLVENPGRAQISRHHRQEVRRAAVRCDTARVNLRGCLDAWCGLYAGLIERRRIRGPAAFGRAQFEAWAALPFLECWAAFRKGSTEPVSMHLWIRDGDRVYSHLAASNQEGYGCGASYAIHASALESFRSARVVHLGGAAGLEERADDGLARFKAGFATSTVTAIFCGTVLDRAAYERLTASRVAVAEGGTGSVEAAYFPAYRG